MKLRVLSLTMSSLGIAILSATVAAAGQYNAVVDIGAPMPEFSELPAVDGGTLS